MTLGVTCPGCGTTYRNINPRYVGNAARCKKCGKKFRIPAPDATTAASDATISAPSSDVDETTEAMHTTVGLVEEATVFSDSSLNPRAAEVVFRDQAGPEASPQTAGTVVRDPGVARTAHTGRIKQKGKVHLAQTVYAGKEVDSRVIDRAEQEVAFEWQIGETILGLYKVTGILGEGGMGRVYKVEHLGWNMELAVKTPKQELMAVPGGAEDFVTEAETWVNLGLHPNLVCCYYVRNLGGIPRVFAEYVEGGSLSEWIRTKKLYEGSPREILARILDVAIQSAWGLHFGHEQGIIHQDMKPANVMMTKSGVAKITDFGLARARTFLPDNIAPNRAGHTMFAPGAGAYTPEYASPEQVHGQALSRKSDMWNWAASIVEMFTGDIFWASGLAVGEFFGQFVTNWSSNEKAPRPPELFVKLIGRCLQMSPEDRPADMIYIVRVLSRIFNEETGKSYPRTEPKRGLATGDILNNKAMSFLDLGRIAEALKAWDEALKVQPYHPQATYNRGIMRRRLGKADDASLMQDVEYMAEHHDHHWTAGYLAGLVHVELGHYQPALKTLEPLLDSQPEEKELQQAVDLARRAIGRTNGLTGQFPEKTDTPHDVADFYAPLMMSRFQKSEETYRYRAEFENEMMMARAAWDAQKASLAANHVRKARSVPGYRVSPFALELWAKLCHVLPRTKLEGGWEKQSLKSHEGPVISVDISRDGSKAVSLGLYGILKHWDVKSGTCIKTISTSSHDEASVTLSYRGHYVLLQAGKTFQIWNLTTGELDGSIQAGSLKVVGTPQGYVTGRCLKFQDPATRSTIDTVELPASRSFCLGPDGKFVFSVSNGVTIEGGLASAGLSPDAKLGISVNKDTIVVAGHGDHSLVRVLKGHVGEILSLVLSPTSEYLVSSGDDHKLKMWASDSGRHIRDFEGHDAAVTCSCVSLSGDYILSGSSDKTIKIWELDSRQCITTLDGHEDTVNSVAVSLDGLTAISGGEDGSVRVWTLDWELDDYPCAVADSRLDAYIHEFVRREGRFKRLEGTERTKKNQLSIRELLYVLSCAGFGELNSEALKHRIQNRTRKSPPSVKEKVIVEVLESPLTASTAATDTGQTLDEPLLKSPPGEAPHVDRKSLARLPTFLVLMFLAAALAIIAAVPHLFGIIGAVVIVMLLALGVSVIVTLLLRAVRMIRDRFIFPGTQGTDYLKFNALQPGVRVSLSMNGGPFQYLGTTGDGGWVKFKGVRAGALVVLLLEKEGFETTTTHFNLPDNAVGKTHVLPRIGLRPNVDRK